ncbi:MAG: hypothetical protein AAF939_05250, partial [Planctomycetota bacterium]
FYLKDHLPQILFDEYWFQPNNLIMAFFPPDRLKSRNIEIDETNVSAESPDVQRRLQRIESNYVQLDEILAELETKISSNERLKAIDEATPDDFELTFGIRRKRKWKSASSKKTPKQSRRRSSGPRKPR